MSGDMSVFQTLIDEAVSKGIGPGFQAVVFNKDQVLFSGVSGYAVAPSNEDPKGREMTPSTILWVASFCKVMTHLIALHAIDHGFISGFTMDDLDNHEKLVQVLPELKQGNGELVTKPGPDGHKVMKLRDAKNKITLRMLLTHTSGYAGGAGWNNAVIARLFEGGDPILTASHLFTGLIKDFHIPLLFEPGTGYLYVLAQFVVRSTGKNLRALYREYILGSLSLSSKETDLWFPAHIKDHIAGLHMKSQNSPNGYITINMPIYTKEDNLEEGYAYPAEGSLFASFRAFVPILQAMLRHDERLLKKETWEKVMKDDLKDRGIVPPRPYITSTVLFSETIDEYVKSTSPDIPPGGSMLSCHVATTPTVSGRPAGSYGWAGTSNTFFFLDSKNSIGGIIGAQMIPFMDPSIVEIRDKFESLVYETFVGKA
ncbi:hypothetical protein Clacol_006179 [Clathrus columnatus]|uniref:Beta-lactamase-related domain-containing protein n=1 Tax=Clathrus columnatus TaxID=1419009 RepID=A0AAV5ABC2_9AGAM|nr:hypothetical protein Clacol_006179 [Clathrus columnatus]